MLKSPINMLREVFGSSFLILYQRYRIACEFDAFSRMNPILNELDRTDANPSESERIEFKRFHKLTELLGF